MKALRIGIEATKIHSQDGGGAYPRQLLEHLLRMDPENQYVVFVSQRVAALDAWPHCKQVPVGYSGGIPATFGHYLRLGTQARQNNLDLLHLLGIYGIRHSPVKTVATVYDLRYLARPDVGASSIAGLLYRYWLPRLIRGTDHVIAISNSTARELKRFYGVSPAKISVVPLGHELPAAVPDRGTLPPLPDRYFLWVGMRSRRKNLETLFLAFRRVIEDLEGTDFGLVVAGAPANNELDRKQRAFVQRLAVDNRVVFTGRVSDSELLYLYDHAQVFLLPSLYEGFGIPILEAMARDVPVITSSDGGATSEVGGDAALYHPARDDAALAQLMQRLVTDPALRKRLIARGRERARAYSWTRTAQATLDVYQTVCRLRLGSAAA